MIQTQIFNVGYAVKLSRRKVESDGDTSWLLEIMVEDKDGKNMHVLELWSDDSPAQMFRVTSNDYLTRRKPAVALMAAGMLVRQVDEMTEEEKDIFNRGLVSKARSHVAVHGDIREGEEGYNPEVHG